MNNKIEIREKNDSIFNYLSSLSEFSKPAKERYEKYREEDPFKNIPPALLNSKDIVKYVLATGMIEDFDIAALDSRATYSCKFSGKYIFWKEGVQRKGELKSEDDYLKILPNSITFIEVKEHFRVPHYMVLRFNLKVSHVYKGLLLGTGPIVDPGFEGKLNIPLHNLTANTYIIKKEAQIIEVEFTKMSFENGNLSPNTGSFQVVNEEVSKLQFENKGPGRAFSEYIEKALTNNDSKFYKKRKERIVISSSLPKEIDKFKQDMKKSDSKLEGELGVFRKIIEEQRKQIDKDSARMEKTETYVKSFTFFTVVTILVACLALSLSAIQFVTNTTKLTEAQKKLEAREAMYEELEKRGSELEARMKILEERINSNGK